MASDRYQRGLDRMMDIVSAAHSNTFDHTATHVTCTAHSSRAFYCRCAACGPDVASRHQAPARKSRRRLRPRRVV